jgi:hypothetical protein
MRRLSVLVAAAVSIGALDASPIARTAPPATAANAHPVYAAIRALGLGDTGYEVADFVLKKDAATFTLTGRLYPLAPVEGRVTGAVFLGKGTMAYEPPLASERWMLRNLTRGEAFAEEFERAVFRFTDDTAELMTAAASGKAAPAPSQARNALKDVNDGLRFRLRDNLHARILHDVLGPAPGRFFQAFVSGRKYSSRLIYTIDPQGVGFVAPEEVQLLSWADNREGIFAAHHLSESYARRERRAPSPGPWIDVEHQVLDTAIETNGELSGDATTTFVSLVDGLRAVPFNLFRTLRVSSVTTADGAPLAWIQESKDEDADFWVILPAAMAPGERLTIRTVYKGRDAVAAAGGDNFFPVARMNWYPNTLGFKDYATYDMRFSVPRRLKLVATGDFVSEQVEGDRAVSRWKSEYPKSVAGFNVGHFQGMEGTAGTFTVVALANSQASNSTKELLKIAEVLKMPVGSLVTTASNKMALTEAQLALQIFSDYFGPISLTRVHMTQQDACNFGQAWPGVIYVPICYYWPAVVRQQIGMQQTNPSYWDSVAAHEVAHLWWGHALGWNSYRDQWMSEGFSNVSASIFLQAAYPNEPDRFRDYWRRMLVSLTEKNRMGVRPIDVGPVTMGARLSSARTGAAAGAVLYPKGAYILHMLRMMMWNRDAGDEAFKIMLRDFVATHRNQPVTTADFQAVVEKHMLPGMDLGGDGTMNWYFRQFVHGTALPGYRLQHTVSKKDGQSMLSLKITQSNVNDGFVMPVPIYVEMENGRVVRLGSATLRGNTTIEQDVPLGQLPVKRAMLNYYYDVLATEER